MFDDPELLAQNPQLAELKAALADAVLRPLTPVYAQLSDLLYREVNTALTGELPVRSAMERVQANSERLLTAAGGQG